jgi:hypothetical protein
MVMRPAAVMSPSTYVTMSTTTCKRQAVKYACRLRVGSSARFVPHKVYETLDEGALGVNQHDTVYLLDYCGPPGLVQRLGKLASRQVW